MQIPTNHITDYAEGGISLRSLTMGGKARSLTGLHRDDYYLFCLLTRGELRLCVDFSEQVVHTHEIGCILPGQVHQFVDARDTEGWLLCVDGVHIGEANRQTMQRFAFSRRVLPAPERQEAELVVLFPMLHCRLTDPNAKAAVEREKNDACINSSEREQARKNAKDFARVAVDVFTEIVSQNDETEKLNPRHRELLFRFTSLLDANIARNRQPAFYADRLNITVGYLNEILTASVGLSTSQYINREIVLCIKRELAYSTLSIQEISRLLGFDDYAYFSRLFSKSVGISPSAFRANYHD